MKKLQRGAIFILPLLFLGTMARNGNAADCVRVVGPAWNSEGQSIDPIITNPISDQQRITTIYEKLVEIGNDYQPQPVLAESWEPNSDGSLWTFHLRKGVKWHNGGDFTSKDVVYSLKRILDPKTSSGGASFLFAIDPNKINAVDDYTVQIGTKAPNGILPTLLGTKYAAMVPYGSTHEQLQKHPVGTGPFMVDTFEPGPKFVANRNPHYWRPGLPKSDCIVHSGITESVSRGAALTSGQTDLLIFIEPTTAATLSKDPNANVVMAPGGSVLDMAMWMDAPPFDDNKVRTALKLVIDRKSLVEQGLLGMGVPGNDNPVVPSSPDAYTHDVISQDIPKAKQLLAEAGHPNGLSVDLYTSDVSPGMAPMAQVYQQMAAKAGIKVNIIMSPADTYWDEIELKRPFKVTTWSDRPTGGALSTAYLSDSEYPEIHMKSPHYDELIHKADATVDPEARRRLYQEAQKFLAEEGGMIIPAFITTAAALRKGCTGYVPNNAVVNYDFASLTCK